MDDETKSFCDSVSSIACSNFSSIDVDNRKPWNKKSRKFPDKISKFQAIEKWLQSLPEPNSQFKRPRNVQLVRSQSILDHETPSVVSRSLELVLKIRFMRHTCHEKLGEKVETAAV